MMLWFLLKSSLLIFPFCLKACLALCVWSLLSCNVSRTKIAIVYAMTILWHKRWYQDMHHGMVCMLWEVWSLMCTSHVAGNTQRLVSMGNVVELSRQMSSCKDLVVEPSQLGSLKGFNGTKDTRIILVRPLTVKVKAYSSWGWIT